MKKTWVVFGMVLLSTMGLAAEEIRYYWRSPTELRVWLDESTAPIIIRNLSEIEFGRWRPDAAAVSVDLLGILRAQSMESEGPMTDDLLWTAFLSQAARGESAGGLQFHPPDVDIQVVMGGGIRNEWVAAFFDGENVSFIPSTALRSAANWMAGSSAGPALRGRLGPRGSGISDDDIARIGALIGKAGEEGLAATHYYASGNDGRLFINVERGTMAGRIPFRDIRPLRAALIRAPAMKVPDNGNPWYKSMYLIIGLAVALLLLAGYMTMKWIRRKKTRKNEESRDRQLARSLGKEKLGEIAERGAENIPEILEEVRRGLAKVQDIAEHAASSGTELMQRLERTETARSEAQRRAENLQEEVTRIASVLRENGDPADASPGLSSKVGAAIKRREESIRKIELEARESSNLLKRLEDIEGLRCLFENGLKKLLDSTQSKDPRIVTLLSDLVHFSLLELETSVRTGDPIKADAMAHNLANIANHLSRPYECFNSERYDVFPALGRRIAELFPGAAAVAGFDSVMRSDERIKADRIFYFQRIMKEIRSINGLNFGRFHVDMAGDRRTLDV